MIRMPVTDSQKLTFFAKDTHSTLEEIKRESFENLWYNLNYHRFFDYDEVAKDEQQKNKHQKDKKQKNKQQEDDKNILIKDEIRAVTEAVEEERLETITEMMDHYEVRILEGTINHSILNGLGAPHFKETNLTLHQLYGVPYLPASSLKGSLKSWLSHTGIKEHPQLLEIEDLLFGTQRNKGILQIMDAFIYKNASIELDYMTPHFKSYYGNKGLPTDDDNPNPISFYRISSKEENKPVTIQFVLLLPKHLRHIAGPSGLNAKELMDGVADWFSKVLEESGLGSKTASGYGRFKEVEDVTEKMLEDTQKKIQARKDEEQRQKEREAEEARIAEKQKRAAEEFANLPLIDQLLKRAQAFDKDREEDITLSKDRGGFVKDLENVIHDPKEDENKKIQIAKLVRTFWKETDNYKPNKNAKHFQSVKMIKDFMQGKS